MAIKLQNSMFVHIPKCAGRWIERQLIDHVEGAEWTGNPIMDAHDTPDADGLAVWAFVREPAHFCNSLFWHRSKRKRMRGSQWNWQDYLRLENECAVSNYAKWMENCGKCENGVEEYYAHYTDKYPECVFGKMENLAEDLFAILDKFGETYDHNAILANSYTPIGLKGKSQETIEKMTDWRRYNINRANRNLCIKFDYPLQRL